MKHTTVKIVPAREETFTSRATCDLCGADIAHGVNEVEIRHRTGFNFVIGKETSVDMCASCFDDKLIPWLCSQGAEPLTKDWEW